MIDQQGIDVVSELGKLIEQRRRRTLSERDFAEAKAALLGMSPPLGQTSPRNPLEDARTNPKESRRGISWVATAIAAVMLLGAVGFYVLRPRDAVPITPDLVVEQLAQAGVPCEEPDRSTGPAKIFCQSLSVQTEGFTEPGEASGSTTFWTSWWTVRGPGWQVTSVNLETAMSVQAALGGELWCTGTPCEQGRS